jgi:hypothetical protein
MTKGSIIRSFILRVVIVATLFAAVIEDLLVS